MLKIFVSFEPTLNTNTIIKYNKFKDTVISCCIVVKTLWSFEIKKRRMGIVRKVKDKNYNTQIY